MRRIEKTEFTNSFNEKGTTKMKRFILPALLILVLATSCNLPTGTTNSSSTTSQLTKLWTGCVDSAQVLAHICLYNGLNQFSGLTDVAAGYTVAPNTIVLVNEMSDNGIAPFIKDNQKAVQGTDYERIAGAQTGLVGTFYTKESLTLATSGKMIQLDQAISLYETFPGWPNWPPVLPTQLAVVDPSSFTPSPSTATPEIVPAAFSSTTFLNLWYSQNETTSLIGLLDQAYGYWGKYYGGEFTAATYSFVRKGTIIWPVSLSNVVDLSKQPIDPYGGCVSTFNEDETVMYTVCDIYVVNPPFKYLTISDWENFQLGMLPAVPMEIHP